MINRLLHGVGWKVDGVWNKREVLIDYSITVTTLFITTLIFL